ncbi:MAG: homoserine kinase [Acidimicrobiia bacterium]|nr:homoserine kinase [Acidimicrobiia bacterium]
MSTASAPASSANLGPGYDTLAMALDLRCRVTAEVSSGWSIHHRGAEPYQGDEGRDAILSTARQVSKRPLRLEIINHIPLCRGLGSSAAALTAGTLAALRANGENPSHDDLFQYVKRMEGHPDNAAAAVYGGLVSVAQGWVVHHSLSPDLVPIVVIPDFEVHTVESRKMVPDCVPLDVAVRTFGRITALIEGLRTGSDAIIENAQGDEVHEKPRLAHYPRLGELIAAANHSGALYACLSGAGPSILCLARPDQVERVRGALLEALGGEGRVMVMSPNKTGAE